MKIYQVGGSIRDELLGEIPKDKDWLVVGSSPEEMIAAGYKPIGKDFPVFIHPISKEEYALARTEKKSGYGYKGFTFYFGKDVTLEEDLSRRDFTINAIAKDPDGKLIDPFNGIEDIERKVFRHVSDAFLEDPLRAIRIARFKTYTHLKHFKIDESTQEMLLKISASGELEKLSKDRVWIEIERSLRSPNASEFFTLLLNFKLHKPWLIYMSNSKCHDQNSAEIKWAELESKNNFKLGEKLPVPNNFKMHVQLLEAMLDCHQDSSEEDLIQSIERINFHRNMTEINALLNLEGLKKNKGFISKLGRHMLEEDFTTLKEASKDEVRNVKLHLIKQAITKTYA
jgi:tRNA nucleotidyltransferase/poly(A) polymerase